MYSQHALQRMQQRGISKQVVDVLLSFGSSHWCCCSNQGTIRQFSDLIS
ncbi:DUF4258 domain-containing protein [Aeromonas media]|uniref:DUF4258 domain-containing protein n=1 Tax=Aeromonas media TaxID=651 RepID=A0AAE7AF50_AERME|nr:DUF4258 domain-containing protein [Aeromonas media]QJT34981.1 DUF4258 domain-containing protein [Aeromonas media]QJT40563.1 DUF4258 domain-containing protein [Aeromonas media]